MNALICQILIILYFLKTSLLFNLFPLFMIVILNKFLCWQHCFISFTSGQTENQVVSEGGTWGEQAEAAENQEASASSRYLNVR